MILVGSMNPEEGDLRPQILDRFGIHVKTDNLLDPDDRVRVIHRNESFDENLTNFRKKI